MTGDLDEEARIDLSAPTYGLDRTGRRRFDLGQREILLVAHGENAIHFEDTSTGQTYARFPPRKKQDDAARHQKARRAWNAIAKPLQESFLNQSARMEAAMLSGRRWRGDIWQRLIMEHPILGLLARRILWRVLDHHDAPLDLIIPDDGGQQMNLAAERVHYLTENHSLQIVHPLTLTDKARRDWCIHLGEFEILQPFPQLERGLYHDALDIDRIANMPRDLDPQVLIDACRRGWEPVFTMGRASSLRYTPPDGDHAILLVLFGHFHGGEGRPLRRATQTISMARIVSMKTGAIIDYTSTHPERLHGASPIAWSEAIDLFMRAHRGQTGQHEVSMSASIDTSPTHDFTEEELARYRLLWDTWPVAPEERPFDEDALIALAMDFEIEIDHPHWVRVDIAKMCASLPEEDGALSREEAAAWLSLLTNHTYLSKKDPPLTPHFVRETMRTISPGLFAKAIMKRVEESTPLTRRTLARAPLMRCLRELIPYPMILDWLLRRADYHALPVWSEALGPPPLKDRDACAKILDAWISTPRDANDYTDPKWTVASCATFVTIPAQDALARVLEHITAAQFAKWTIHTYRMALRLEDTERAAEIFDLLAQKIPRGNENLRAINRPTPEDFARFIARFGTDNPQRIFDLLVAPFSKNDRFDEILAAAFHIKAPEFLVSAYAYARKKPLADSVEAYATSGEPYALEGLLRLCRTRSKKREWALGMMRQTLDAHEGAREMLAALAAQNHSSSVQKLIDAEFPTEATLDADEEVASLPEDELPAWMSRILEFTWPGDDPDEDNSPDWLRAHTLPALRLKDDPRDLSANVSNALFAAFHMAHSQETTIKKPEARGSLDALLSDALEALDTTSLQHTVARAIEAWEASQNARDGDWLLEMAKRSEGGLVIDALASYIRAARPKTIRSAHEKHVARAQDILAHFDSAEAWWHLKWQRDRLAAQTEYKHARKLIADFAYTHQMSKEEFSDYAVPSFGLNRRGEREFDLGSRQLVLQVHGRDEIQFKDAKSEKVYARFPPKRKRDDEELYMSARDRYASISGPLREVFIEQNVRMEKLMLSGRRWPASQWLARVVEHPILGHLARRIVWSVSDSNGGTLDLILPDASGSFMNVNMETFDLDMENHSLSIPHPLDMSAEVRNAWLEQLADFEIIQPFPQIAREVYIDDQATDELRLLAGEMLSKNIFEEACERGWIPFNVTDRGEVYELALSTLDDRCRIEVELGSSLRVHPRTERIRPAPSTSGCLYRHIHILDLRSGARDDIIRVARGERDATTHAPAILLSETARLIRRAYDRLEAVYANR